MGYRELACGADGTQARGGNSGKEIGACEVCNGDPLKYESGTGPYGTPVPTGGSGGVLYATV